jgi:hypothetical protein
MSGLRQVAVFAIPVVLYFAVRPLTDSDAVALAIAGALPLAYQMIVVLVGRRVDRWAVVSAIGLVLACVVSAFAGGSSLPLKLHEAGITFTLGLVLLPTSTYVVAGRLINWGTLAIGALLLWTYLRHLRATAGGAVS